MHTESILGLTGWKSIEPILGFHLAILYHGVLPQAVPNEKHAWFLWIVDHSLIQKHDAPRILKWEVFEEHNAIGACNGLHTVVLGQVQDRCHRVNVKISQ